MTIAVFVGGFISALVVSAILLSISYIIESLEYIERKIQTIEDSIADQKAPGKEEWKCPVCGRINASYITTCICGEPK